MHNLSEEQWLLRKDSIEPWSANTTANSEQEKVQAVLAKMSNAKFGRNCFVAPDCNFFTDSARLGNSVKIASLATLRGNIVLGNDVSVNPLTNLIGKVTVGNAVRIASSVQIFGFNHGFARIDKYIKDQPINTTGIVIGDGTWIGAGATILDGVTVGKNCIVAAGAVVTKSFDDFSIIAGNPAKVIKSRLSDSARQVSLSYQTKHSNALDFCVDLPVTGYLDSDNARLNGWIATSKNVTGLYLVTGNTKEMISLNNNREDVRKHLESFRPSLFKNGKIVGFTTPKLQGEHELVLELEKKVHQICAICLSR
jgi:acetyltransferase-like isoleucine patch superfamily enzyme